MILPNIRILTTICVSIHWKSMPTVSSHFVLSVRDNYCCSTDECFSFSGTWGTKEKPCDSCHEDLLNAFLCEENKRCIYDHHRCNGVLDCGPEDGSDEMNCVNCKNNAFHCWINNRCILISQQCDGNADCGPGDTSDEDNRCLQCMHQQINHFIA